MKKKILLFSASLLLIANSMLSNHVSAQTQLWSMTVTGGANNDGVIFKINLDGSGYTRAYDFAANGGASPYGSLIMATNDKLYGMTKENGPNVFGNGSLFSIDPVTNAYTDLFDFDGGLNGGGNPTGNLMLASDGKLYGETGNGGANGTGVIFSLDPNATSNAFKKLYDFDFADYNQFSNYSGAYPYGSLIQVNGLLYGITGNGGSTGTGVIFSFDPATNTETPLYSFPNTTDNSNLMLASNGLLYGMLSGNGNNYFGGIFSFDPVSNTYQDVYDFDASEGEIYNANGDLALVQATNGLLYGMTQSGGAFGKGQLFSFDPTINALSDLLDFNNSDGYAFSYGNLFQASNGLLYGMTFEGGSFTDGSVFSFDTDTANHNPLTDLTDFNSANGDGIYSYSSFIEVAAPAIIDTIAAGTVTSPLCAGSANVIVPCFATGIYNAGNIFTAQLSDANGNFASPVNIGTLASVTSGADTIYATIPSAFPAGTGYRIRVISSNPVDTGSANGVDITIQGSPIATLSGGVICAGASLPNVILELADSPNWNLAYTFNNGSPSLVSGITSNSYIISGAAAGNYAFTVTDGNGCSASASTVVLVNPMPTINAVSNQTVSNGTATNPVNFSGSMPGVNYIWTNNTPSIGLAAGGTGNIAAFSATNTGATAVTATITATPVSSGFAYIPNNADGTVSIINTTANAVIATVRVGNGPTGVAVGSEGGSAYITNTSDNTVSVITGGVVTDTIPVGNNPEGIAISPAGDSVYVANFLDNTVSVINTATNKVAGTIGVGATPYNIVISPDGGTVYVSTFIGDAIYVIKSGAVTSVIPVGATLISMAISPDGGTIYVGCSNNSGNWLSVVSTATNLVTDIIPVSISGRMALSADGSTLYSNNQSGNTISVINTATFAVSPVVVGTNPSGVSVSPDGNQLYVPNGNSGSVSVISTATNTVTNTVIVGSGPVAIGNFVTGTNCSGTPVTFTITVNPGTMPTATLSGGGTVCAGATLPDVSIALTGTAPWTLTYTIDGNPTTVTVSAGDPNPYIIAGAAAGIYAVTALSDANGVGTSFTGSVLVTINPLPTITATLPGSSCGAGNVTLGATASAGTVDWYAASTGGSSIATGNTYTTSSISATTTYYVDATNSGCTTASRTAIVATINTLPAAPTASVTSQPTCTVPTGTITITAPKATGMTYSIDGSNYTNTTGVFTGVATGTYHITAGLGSCFSSGTTVVVNALSGAPAAPVVTVVNNCGNSVLSTTAKGTLHWSTGATTSSITVTAPGTYSVTTTVNGCTSAAGTHAAAPIAIPPTPVITVVNKCGSSVLSTTAKGSLLWTYRYTTSSITATTAGTYLVIATVNGCASLPGEATAAPSPFPDKPVVTVVNNCGSSELYSDAQGTLKWSTGETGIFITVTTAKTYSVTVTNGYGCTSAAGTGTAAPVKSAPATAGAITGNSTGPCNNTSPFTYSIAAVPGATSYIWTLPSGCTAPSIITTVPNIEVTFTPLALTGYMFVQASNACGAGNASNKKITLNCPGKWTPLTNKAPHYLTGDLTLLSDGTVLAKSSDGGGVGNVYDRLTPVNGSYSDGKWDSIAPMHETRLWYSSQVLKDGRLYVAGGEYGSGKDSAEVYDPLTGLWTPIINPRPASGFFDANSEVLDNGNVLQSIAISNNINNTWQFDYTFNPATDTYAPCCNGSGIISNGNQDESTWVKLPDGSILMVEDPINAGLATDSSERYIPSLGNWVPDATVPVQLYDIDHEEGPGFLLPDGRAFFIGAGGHTAYYTPSGGTANGSWVQGPDIPNKQGTPDAPAAMMVNGKILCIVSPIGTTSNGYPAPVSFYEFDYLGGTNGTFTQVPAPGNPPGDTLSMDTYSTIMLDLPDGNVLLGFQNVENHTYYNPPSSKQYYIYTPGNGPLPAGKPIISGYSHCASLMLTGTLFNGISEGACFGDDDQMSTNRPLVRLTNGSKVYYCRTFNWNHTGVQRGSEVDTVYFTLPKGLPIGPTYSLVVVANGIASDPISVSDFTLDIPAAPGAITGPNGVCYGSGGTRYTYSITPVASAASYIWTFDYINQHIISSSTTTTPSITTGFAIDDNLHLTVQAVSACGGISLASPQSLIYVQDPCNPRMAGTAPDGPAATGFVAYPNPAHDKLNVAFNSTTSGEYTVKMFDMTGRLLFDRTANAAQGDNFIELDLGVFAKGIYVLSFSSGEESRQVRIVVE